MAEGDDTVRFTLLEETGPLGVLLFTCKGCPDSKLTSHQLESHMVLKHQASKFTVDTATAMRNRAKPRTPQSKFKVEKIL